MGVLNTTYTFLPTDVITSTKMNNIIDESLFTDDAIVSGNLSLEQVGGKLKVKSSGIGSNELATGAVTTTKITDLNVTTGKLADSAITTAKIADSNVTTAKIADSAVTFGKITLPSNFPVQIVQVDKTDTQEFTSNASDWVDITDLSVTLTRVFANASGKVLIQGVVNTDTNNVSYGAAIRIQRDGTTIGIGDAGGIRQRATTLGSNGSGFGASPLPFSFLDTSPGSGSTVTYKIQARAANSVITYINRGNNDTDNSDYIYRTISTLTVTELSP